MNNISSHSVQSVKLGWVRCYLLKCTGGYLLIDVYYPGYYAKFEEKLEKIGIAALLIYLAIAVPLALLNNQAMENCATECSKQGFDIVISAASQGNAIQCRCLNQYDRSEKTVVIG